MIVKGLNVDTLPMLPASVLVIRHPCGCVSAGLVYDRNTSDDDIGRMFREALARGAKLELLQADAVKLYFPDFHVPHCPQRPACGSVRAEQA